jgi:hypothetical protein
MVITRYTTSYRKLHMINQIYEAQMKCWFINRDNGNNTRVKHTQNEIVEEMFGSLY